MCAAWWRVWLALLLCVMVGNASRLATHDCCICSPSTFIPSSSTPFSSIGSTHGLAGRLPVHWPLKECFAELQVLEGYWLQVRVCAVVHSAVLQPASTPVLHFLLAHGGDCSYVMMHSLLSPLTSVSAAAIFSRQSLPPPPLCCSFRYNLDRQGYQALGNTTMGSSGSGGAVVDTVVLVTPPLVTSNRTAVFVFDGRASGGPSTGFSVEVWTWLGVDAQCVCDCVWLCVWKGGGVGGRLVLEWTT